MLHYLVKLALTSLLIVAISEIAKRHSGTAALLAFVWLYLETGNTQAIAQLSGQIFWLVIPSLLLFLALPALIRWGWGFWPSLIAASGLTAAAYLLLLPLLRRFGLL